jgi:hypothetical protein
MTWRDFSCDASGCEQPAIHVGPLDVPGRLHPLELRLCGAHDAALSAGKLRDVVQRHEPSGATGDLEVRFHP